MVRLKENGKCFREIVIECLRSYLGNPFWKRPEGCCQTSWFFYRGFLDVLFPVLILVIWSQVHKKLPFFVLCSPETFTQLFFFSLYICCCIKEVRIENDVSFSLISNLFSSNCCWLWFDPTALQQGCSFLMKAKNKSVSTYPPTHSRRIHHQPSRDLWEWEEGQRERARPSGSSSSSNSGMAAYYFPRWGDVSFLLLLLHSLSLSFLEEAALSASSQNAEREGAILCGRKTLLIKEEPCVGEKKSARLYRTYLPCPSLFQAFRVLLWQLGRARGLTTPSSQPGWTGWYWLEKSAHLSSTRKEFVER